MVPAKHCATKDFTLSLVRNMSVSRALFSLYHIHVHVLSMKRQFHLKFKERGGGQTLSTSFWMRFSQSPLCRYRFKVIYDDIIFLLSDNIIEYIYF